jgi:FixJ family two-component response regulator
MHPEMNPSGPTEFEEGVVYVVDDDLSVRRSLEFLAQSVGLDARGFATGTEFLATTRDARPACVVLDLHLSDMHGLEVQRQLARTDPVLPVVVITGYGDDLMKRAALAAGAVAYLSKPFDERSLLEAIRQSLSGASNRGPG